MNHHLAACIIGIGGSLAMDGGSAAWNRIRGGRSLDYRLVGRWLSHMRSGQLSHPSIMTAEPMPHEREIGLLAHYGIGIAFAEAMLLRTGRGWLRRPTLLPALITGVSTIVAPWFVMQPAFGMGIAASRTPNPSAARKSSLRAHTFYGIGLWLTAQLLRRVAR